MDFFGDNEDLKSESDEKISKNLDMNNQMDLKNKKVLLYLYQGNII